MTISLVLESMIALVSPAAIAIGSRLPIDRRDDAQRAGSTSVVVTCLASHPGADTHHAKYRVVKPLGCLQIIDADRDVTEHVLSP